ncbi:hypothetical protein J4403_01905 [Candidatus Woesearchaeota archaeon]|nr:hypothetical protein [Candidatus Woesearchaeota archaeon]
MNKIFLFIFLSLSIVFLTGCVNQVIQLTTLQSNDTTITSFVSEPNFPKLQKINLLLDIPEKDIKVFDVKYGEPKDCESGCFYSRAVGIKNSDKIGWISISDYDNLDLNKLKVYNFDEKDEYLFTKDFFNKLKAKDDWIYQYQFLKLLAEDSDVPNETLLRITEDLPSFIDTALALSLLKNPKIQENKQILTMIINLPYGAPGSEIKLQAQEYLNKLE